MGVTIEQLNEKYGEEARKHKEYWNFSLFTNWLEKKGIPNTPQFPIVATVLEKTLMDFSSETLPPDHDTFDKCVYMLAVHLKQQANNKILEHLNQSAKESIENAIKKYDEDWYKLGKFKRIWKVITGND